MPSDESKGSQLDAIGSLAQRQLDNTVPRAVGFTIVWLEGVIFGSIMTYHVQILLLVRQPLFDRAALAAHTGLMGASAIKCW